MNIILNGQSKTINNNINLSNLVNELNLNDKIFVIEVNTNIINKEDYDNTFLKDYDQVEVVGFVGGG